MPASRKRRRAAADPKTVDLERNAERSAGELLTTNQGLRINDDQNSLKAGDRGPSLLEDFQLREKITHFDHERIPERVVHARGAAAHGVFRVYKSLAPLTRAKFLQDPGVETPVFVRFSTVAGSRGSTDLARDVRGFAVKFYTSEGNFDLVGNNIPVFFIQDAIKFPDLIHAVKPEPHNEIPQAASAHDTFWDFISLMPESMHMIMWVMSDRAIPRSLRMMEGFGIHTFRLINERGQARFVKFHWKPLLGVHSVLWDEATLISGKDPDFHRRDLWEAIESGAFPEWEFGIQVVEEKDEHRFGFDLLDPTKLIPEEVVPVQRIGRLTLNRNPANFFAETEQVAFHPGHIVSGIDFSNDPLLQGRLFSYLDTQLTRLGGPNFHEIPINRPVALLHNNQRDGSMRQMINHGQASYHPNTLGGGCPMQARGDMGGFVSHAQRMDGAKVRARSASFFDHFSQAALFFASQAPHEQAHIVNALRFELGKVQSVAIRERMVGMLAQVDTGLAKSVAQGLGLSVVKPQPPLNHSIPADGKPSAFEPRPVVKPARTSPALSMARPAPSIATRKVAVLTAPGCDKAAIDALDRKLAAAGATISIVGPHLGALTALGAGDIQADFSLLTASSVLFDALYVPGGSDAVDALLGAPDAIRFVRETYRHCKPIAATGDGVRLLARALDALPQKSAAPAAVSVNDGVITGPDHKAPRVADELAKAMAQHRFFAREAAFAPPPDPVAGPDRPSRPTRATSGR
jgi:catalase